MPDLIPYDSLSVSDEDAAWDAFFRRDRSADGRFVVAVMSTGIYCRPSCPARRPRREHVRFHPTPQAAQAAGFRACMRCLPDQVARDRQAVASALALLEESDGIPSLTALAQAVGYAPHHFHRLFKRATGVTPAAYARGLRNRRADMALKEQNSVTAAVYKAGYAAPSRFYADSEMRRGMAPGQWRRGGDGVTIDWAMIATPLGPMLAATTERGLARLAFDEDETMLVEHFAAARIATLGDVEAEAITRLVAALPLPDPDLPETARRIAFLEAVTQGLTGRDQRVERQL
ncbi:helix-turn-helix domain-containing protein [Sphingomonas sanguinis]|uniref:bifunctional transcriptional activator/DNA repair enzyme AdaA n=1 Tax=Sphingomonas sp. LC-1 TaxID=3110957 RepID=UPI0021BB7BEE|nr:Ada metal-binding domain-containing protein [Sphingomonas sp. LC-1]MCT8002494.1 helix-turn-helix domain-containing protein [Sphingomonas sp. LC-1]